MTTKMSKKVTIRDIAEKAGVSYQTVSRVLNNRLDVAQETRETVLAIIKDLNYRPSLAARILNQKKTMIMGIIMPFDPEFLAADTHQLQIMCGVNRQASLRDYNTLLSTPRSVDDHLSAYNRLLQEHIVDGVIVLGERDTPGAEYLVEKGYPVVLVGYTHSNLYSVHSDDQSGAYGLAQHLIALGHRRIGVISGPKENLAMQARWKGFERAIQDARLDLSQQTLVYGNFTSASGNSATEALMKSSTPPTAIFAFNDRMAMGAIRWLNEHNINVPNDVSVAGFDDIPNAEDFNPALTTVHQHSYDLGQRAGEILIDLIDGKSLRNLEVVLPTYLTIRQSTAVLNRNR
jgi:DNA-binding LacI/PurR family transcriptional regulator